MQQSLPAILSKSSKVIFVVLTLFISASLTGCASTSPVEDEKIAQEKVFEFTYDQVWLATQLVMARYPMHINNMDLGILETRFIPGHKAWKPAHSDKRIPGGLRYKITARLIKGDVGQQNATKVIIGKQIKLKRDFFGEEESLRSDGLEERVILYRIQRELVIERALKRATKKENKI